MKYKYLGIDRFRTADNSPENYFQKSKQEYDTQRFVVDKHQAYFKNTLKTKELSCSTILTNGWLIPNLMPLRMISVSHRCLIKDFFLCINFFGLGISKEKTR